MPAQVRSAAGSNSGASASTTMTAAMPAGFQAGDLLIGVAESALAAAPTARGGGVTPLRNMVDATSNMDVVWKAATGGDAAFTWTVTSRKWAVVTIAIVAGTWDATGPTPFHIENGGNHTAAATASYTTPAVTLSADDLLLLAAFGNRGSSTWTVPAQSPPMTLGAQSTSTGTNPASAAIIHSALNAVPQGSISRTATASVSQADACRWIGAIMPAASGTPAGRPAPVYGQRFIRRAVSRSTRW